MPINLMDFLTPAAELVSESSLLDLVELIWENDRYFTYPRFHATARKVSAKLRDFGVRPRTFELPADGKTILGDWKMPLGWDCRAAHLEIYEPFEERGRVLADRQKQPCHVIMWSGPTQDKGVIAELIRIADGKELEAKKDAVKGKLVYTPADPRAFKRRLHELGARGVVTSWCRNAHHLPEAVFWFNGWSDQSGGWAFHAGDAPLPGIAVSSQTGVELEVLMERGPVKLKMVVESEYLETTMPVVCGYIDAPLQEEVLAIGHIMEQGANDNASGAAVILESLRALQNGTQSGRLKPLRRCVRGLLVNECYGTIAFAAQNPGIIRRMIGGVNWDSLGRHQEGADGGFRHHRCPDAMASVVDTLLVLLLEAWMPKAAPYALVKRERPYTLTDNCYNDPLLGVPTSYVDSQDRFWHTSADTPKDLSSRTLHAFATVSTAYLHFLATATAREALWLAHQTSRRYAKQMEDVASACVASLADAGDDKAAVLARAFDHLSYLKEISDRAVMSAKSLMLKEERAQGHLELLKVNRHTRKLLELQKRRLAEWAGCEPSQLPAIPGIEEFAALRPFKRFIGTPTYATIPEEERNQLGSPVWNFSLHGALFWADGKTPFAEILRRVGYEFRTVEPAEIAAHFQLMARHGLIQWLKEGEKVPKLPALKSAGGEEGPLEGGGEPLSAEVQEQEPEPAGPVEAPAEEAQALQAQAGESSGD